MILSTVLGWRWIRDPWKRRGLVAAAALPLAILCVWPRTYMARSRLLPDSGDGGLASLIGAAGGAGVGLSALGALVGTPQSIESDLAIARSQPVIADVAQRLRARGMTGGRNPDRLEATIRHQVEVEATRGSILQLTMYDHDPVFAKAVIADYVLAVRARLADLKLEQTAQKRAVAVDRMTEATAALAHAQSALDSFRAANRLAAPEVQLGASISLLTELEGKLQAAEAELKALLEFATPDNIQVQAAKAEISSLQSQIAAAQASAKANPSLSVGGMSPKITEYENLYRDEKYAEAAFEIYKRYLDTVTVDQLSATINVDVLDPAYVDPDRHYNVRAVGALLLLLVMEALAEFYVARPSVGQE